MLSALLSMHPVRALLLSSATPPWPVSLPMATLLLAAFSCIGIRSTWARTTAHSAECSASRAASRRRRPCTTHLSSASSALSLQLRVEPPSRLLMHTLKRNTQLMSMFRSILRQTSYRLQRSAHSPLQLRSKMCVTVAFCSQILLQSTHRRHRPDRQPLHRCHRRLRGRQSHQHPHRSLRNRLPSRRSSQASSSRSSRATRSTYSLSSRPSKSRKSSPQMSASCPCFTSHSPRRLRCSSRCKSQLALRLQWAHMSRSQRMLSALLSMHPVRALLLSSATPPWPVSLPMATLLLAAFSCIGIRSTWARTTAHSAECSASRAASRRRRPCTTHLSSASSALSLQLRVEPPSRLLMHTLKRNTQLMSRCCST